MYLNIHSNYVRKFQKKILLNVFNISMHSLLRELHRQLAESKCVPVVIVQELCPPKMLILFKTKIKVILEIQVLSAMRM
jgi:hypothetical protein